MMCLIPLLVNFYMPISSMDNAALNKASRVCNQTYSTCVKSVIKRPNNMYVVKCYTSNNVHRIEYRP